MTDGELWNLAREGDEPAWRTLYQRYLPTVWRYVFLRLGRDRQLVEDVVSETFLALVRLLSTREAPVDSLAGWLLSVARHKIDDQWRRDGRQETMLAQVCQTTCDAAADAASECEQHEVRLRVLSLLGELPPDERMVLEWKYLDGHSVREIARRLGRTEKAVESLLFRARRAFRILEAPTHKVTS